MLVALTGAPAPLLAWRDKAPHAARVRALASAVVVLWPIALAAALRAAVPS